MSLALPVKTRLAAPVYADDTHLQATDDLADVCACLAEPSHMFATLYTATLSERVLITGCAAGELVFTRGVNGTEARDWPANACLLIDTVVDGAVCSGDMSTTPCAERVCDAFGVSLGVSTLCDAFGAFIDDTTLCDAFGVVLCEYDPCLSSNPLDQISVGKGLTINRDNPAAPVLHVAATGVVPGNYGGAEVNECGQLVSIPVGWPSTGLADFSPCCDEGSVSTVAEAASVSFTPSSGSTIATAGNVQSALQQVDDYLSAFVVPDAGVQAIIAGDCIAVGGTAANPVVSLSAGVLTPGVYGGFTINSCGLVTGYTPVAAQSTIVQGSGAAAVAFNGTDTYTVSVQPASKTDCGCALLADEALLGGSESLIVGDTVVTWDFLQVWQATNAGIASVSAGHDAVAVSFNGTDTYSITVAPDLVAADGDPIVVTLNPATGKLTVSVETADVGVLGAVRIADSAGAGNPVAVPLREAIDIEFLEAWATARGI